MSCNWFVGSWPLFITGLLYDSVTHTLPKLPIKLGIFFTLSYTQTCNVFCRWEWIRQDVSFQVLDAIHSDADAPHQDQGEESADSHQSTAGGVWQCKNHKEQQRIKICKSPSLTVTVSLAYIPNGIMSKNIRDGSTCGYTHDGLIIKQVFLHWRYIGFYIPFHVYSWDNRRERCPYFSGP